MGVRPYVPGTGTRYQVPISYYVLYDNIVVESDSADGLENCACLEKSSLSILRRAAAAMARREFSAVKCSVRSENSMYILFDVQLYQVLLKYLLLIVLLKI